MPPTSGLTRAFDLWRISNDLEIRRRLTCNNVAAIAGLVAAGLGIAFFVQSWSPRLARHRSVVGMALFAAPAADSVPPAMAA